MDLKSIRGCGRAAVIANRRGQKVQLEIRVADAGPASDEGAGLEVIGGAEPGAERQPLKTDPRACEKPEMRIQRNRTRARLLHIDLEMVLQAGAHARPVGDDLHSVLAELLRRADS